MNEQEAPTTSENPDQPSELPPIPDGGLAKAMPPWLAEPPARPSKLAGEPTPLDLQTLAGSAVLPRWLDDLSNRVGRDAGMIPPDETMPTAESPVESQVSVVEETIEEPDIPPIQVTDVVEAAAIAAPPVIPKEPMPEPKKEPLPVLKPLPETKAEISPEPRSRSTYLLYALVIVVVVTLAAWLIWG